MQRFSLLFLSLLAACAPDPDDFLDVTGTWAGDCDLAANIYTGVYTATVTLESLDEVDTFGVTRTAYEGRPLVGDVSVDFAYDGSDETWGAGLDGHTSEGSAFYFETYDAAELWGIIIAGTASGSQINADCVVGAWSAALDEMVWTTGSVVMDKL